MSSEHHIPNHLRLSDEEVMHQLCTASTYDEENTDEYMRNAFLHGELLTEYNGQSRDMQAIKEPRHGQF